MLRKIVVLLIVAVAFKEATAVENDKSTKIITPIQIAKYQIEKLMKFVNTIIAQELHTLAEMKESIRKLTENVISTATNEIDAIFDNAMATAKRIFRSAIDKGLNITECFVINTDQLRNLRRALVLNEIQCATSQIGEFYTIIDNTVANFTGDLSKVAEYPKRLEKCLITITAIPCITKVVNDANKLQQDIPAQIFGTMMELSEYMKGFDQRVHKCQFEELRHAVNGTRDILDDLSLCARKGTT